MDPLPRGGVFFRTLAFDLNQKQEKWSTLLLLYREESDTFGCNNNRRFS